MPNHVFTYGSLMFAPVWDKVVLGRYRSAAAWLDNHARYALADDTYPGMVAERGARVDGLVYFDVSDADLARLDAFEGNEYRRIAVPLTLHHAAPADPVATPGSATQSGALSAQTYLFTAVHRLSLQPWIPEAFALERFQATYCRDNLAD